MGIRRTATSAAAVALVAAISLVGTASGPREVRAQTSTVSLELVEQQYSFEADEPIRLVYRVSGDLAAIELTPPDPEEDTPDPAVPDPSLTGPGAADPLVTPEAPPVAVPVALTLQITNYPPLTDPDGVDDVVGADVDRDAFGPEAIDGVELTDVRGRATFADDGTVTLRLRIPTDVTNSVENRLKFDQPGLHPIRTELYVGDPGATTLLATHGTVVQRLPGPTDPADPAPPINLAVMSAVTDAPATASILDLPEATAAFDESVELAAAITAPVTLQVTPTVVEAATSTESGSERLERSLADDEFVSQPALRVDVSSLVAVGREEVFARQLSAGEDMLTEAVPTTPSRRTAWLAADALSAGGAQELRDLGFRYIVMPEQLYRQTVDSSLPDTDLFVNTALPDGGTLPLIVLDPIATELTTDSADRILADATPIEWAVETVTEMLTERATESRSELVLERSRILSAPDLGTPDARLLGGLETLVSTTPSIRFSNAASLTGSTDTQTDAGTPVVVDLPETAGPPLDDRLALLDATAFAVAGAGSMLPSDDPRPTEWSARLETLISSAFTDEEVAAAVDEIRSDADEIRAGVVPPDPFTFTLTGRSGDIELRIGNTTDESLDVVMRLDSPKLTFPGADDPGGAFDDHTVTLRPNSETSVIVPVRALSNGTSPIRVELLTPSGEPLGGPVTLTSRVTAFTGLGQVLTVGFVLVLLSWWFAHWRARRRNVINEGRGRHPSVVK